MLFSWFGAVRLQRKPLPYQTDLPRSQHHNFVKRKPLSYYLNPPDDSDEEGVDVPSGVGSPGKLQDTLEPKGKLRAIGRITGVIYYSGVGEQWVHVTEKFRT